MNWIDHQHSKLPLARQCTLAGVSKATLYRQQETLERQDRAQQKDNGLRTLIDEQYTARPFYGSRRMVEFLKTEGHSINRKRVQRLMRQMGLAGMAPRPSTSSASPQHKAYPYLLRGVQVTKPNQVWSTNITYIRLSKGFAYLVAIIDWYSRQVLAWRVSNSMDTAFCVDCLEDALRQHGTPEVFNSDQGTQFTSQAFTEVLKREGVKISMDGRGRALDNIFVERLWRTVKYEDVYLKGYTSIAELTVGLAQYFVFYNTERPHQSLGYKTPKEVYLSGEGGGAAIADKYSKAPTATPCGEPPLKGETFQGADESNTGQRRAAVYENESSLN